ncbi:rhodanese-like domain-containing protein [Cyanobacterium stanieri LEGE 03274]|uniref:Rhodanese-like domain-containing protein n=1 Tax=Cyanobacterium stanieri LEGE 03274 TaxID=1828756 RepID=A0ABR9V626_9CHRO|nr:rhodanese-like domain-containing protein [Cyanobacterium stanieri]MBE9223347.1 rhodanese-like domain-containing protein [Cyanobacterium stanieri LEGE 03274]
MIIANIIQSQYQLISPQELEQRMKNNSVVVIDVREKDEYEKGHIPGALLKPLSEFSAKELASYPNIVLYCRSGKRSHTVAEKLIETGMTMVTELKGGITAWQEAHLPVAT